MHVYNLTFMKSFFILFRIIVVVSIDIIVNSKNYYLKLIWHYLHDFRDQFICMHVTEFAKGLHFMNLECSGVVNAHAVEII